MVLQKITQLCRWNWCKTSSPWPDPSPFFTKATWRFPCPSQAATPPPPSLQLSSLLMTLFQFHRETEAVRKNTFQLPALWLTNPMLSFHSKYQKLKCPFVWFQASPSTCVLNSTCPSVSSGMKTSLQLLYPSLLHFECPPTPPPDFPCSFCTAWEHTWVFHRLKATSQTQILLTCYVLQLPPYLSFSLHILSRSTISSCWWRHVNPLFTHGKPRGTPWHWNI